MSSLSGLRKYEQLRGDIAKLLDKEHCEKLGMLFPLEPAENDKIQRAAESGKMLMKILDERELIMPKRMIRLYEGLKAIHFNKVARLVLEYIDTSQEKNVKEEEGEDGKRMVKLQEKQVVISKRESKLSVNFKILKEEGYKRLDIQRALKLSHGKLDLGRRVLLLAKEEHEKIIKWSQERKHFSCSMNSQHFAVEAEKPGLIGLNVPFIAKMLKRVCVLPIVNRVSESGDQLTIHLWFHNDDSLEHKSLINEEIYQQQGSIMHDPVSVVLNSMASTLRVSTNSSTSQCNPRKVDVAMETLWLKNRHKVEFHFQNKGINDTVNLEIEARYGMFSKNLFQLSIQLQIDKLRHNDQITSPFQLILPESIIKSFDQLKRNLSEQLDVDQSTMLANIIQLPHEEITDIKKHKTPGNLLMEKLTKNALISPSNIANLENALTEQGNEECAKLVRDFRWKNPVVQATMCP
ncbi:hypothetical protein BSL78_13594 [Apostichopus japonicus]|uniref:Uncharacterized protein n=1 Tax=Stichopus japonicus TaxID=307972 RepID=A0A2G8KNE6_STIJA|nr:hypothetical protein BSL78_13594 [Apostichopus japonicus]